MKLHVEGKAIDGTHVKESRPGPIPRGVYNVARVRRSNYGKEIVPWIVIVGGSSQNMGFPESQLNTMKNVRLEEEG